MALPMLGQAGRHILGVALVAALHAGAVQRRQRTRRAVSARRQHIAQHQNHTQRAGKSNQAHRIIHHEICPACGARPRGSHPARAKSARHASHEAPKPIFSVTAAAPSPKAQTGRAFTDGRQRTRYSPNASRHYSRPAYWRRQPRPPYSPPRAGHIARRANYMRCRTRPTRHTG
jgi:hypothetical protein